ncbi:hypothetical protein [Amycolatopsis orientalis]|uniref:hypothetical protein n=1 Tax=Amycolatopsis orientalis TaxID=31958 RepID=UPI000A6961AA|nr:hypothetical protein [Amycolatopsis orientalis]
MYRLARSAGLVAVAAAAALFLVPALAAESPSGGTPRNQDGLVLGIPIGPFLGGVIRGAQNVLG